MSSVDSGDIIVDALSRSVPISPAIRPNTVVVAEGLDFPTSAAVAGDGALYVAESGLPFGGARPGGRIVRIGADGSSRCVLEGLRAPVNGLVWHDGGFYISEGGFPGRVSRWTPGGARQTVLDGLPGRGNYHTNMVAVGPDGWLYFSQGAMTNSGVVGLDAYEIAWLKQLPHPFDLPGFDIVLAGETFTTSDPVSPNYRDHRDRERSDKLAKLRRFRPLPKPCDISRWPSTFTPRVATSSASFRPSPVREKRLLRPALRPLLPKVVAASC